MASPNKHHDQICPDCGAIFRVRSDQRRVKCPNCVTTHKRGMTVRQQRFVDEYLVDLDANAAARRAGYSEKVARHSAPRIMRQPGVAEAIAKAMAARSKRTQITADRVIEEVARIAFSDLRALFREDGSLKPISEWPDDVARAVAAVEVDELHEGSGKARVRVGSTRKVKLWSKVEAIDKLMRHLGLLKEQPAAEVNLNVTVNGARERISSRIAGLVARGGKGGDPR